MTFVTLGKESRQFPRADPIYTQGVWPECNSHVAAPFPCHVLFNVLR